MSNINPKKRFKDKHGDAFPDWECKTLADIASQKSSNITAKTNHNKGAYKIYGAAGVFKNVNFFVEKEKYISIVKIGTVGKVKFCAPFTSVLGTLDTIKAKKSNSLYFVYYILKNFNFKKYTFGSTMPHIYFKQYSREKIKVPCSEEQNKIVNALELIDKKISLLDEKKEKTKLYRKALVQQLFPK